MQHVEMVPGVRLKRNRGILLDRRRSLTKPNYIGMIMPNLEGPGFTFCPLVFQRLKFKQVPPIFQSPNSAANWISTQKSVIYLIDHYSIFNTLLWWLYLMPINLKVFMHVRSGTICTLVPATALMYFAKPADPVLFFLTKTFMVFFGLRAILEFRLLKHDLKRKKEID